MCADFFQEKKVVFTGKKNELSVVTAIVHVEDVVFNQVHGRV